MSLTQQSTFYTRSVSIAAIALLAVVVAQLLWPLATPLGWAMLCALLLHPAHTLLRRKLGRRAHHATWIMTLAAGLALLLPALWLSSVFASQAAHLLQLINHSLLNTELQQWATHPWVQRVLNWFDSTLHVGVMQLQSWAGSATQSVLQHLAAMSGAVVLGTLGTIGNLLLTLFLLFFFLRDGPLMVASLRDLVPMQAAARDELLAHLASVTRAVVFGTGLTALIQGLLVGLAFVFTGLPSPAVFGVLAMLLALLPVGGTAIVWVPASLVLYAGAHWVAGTFMLLWGALLVSMIDNFLKPMLISGRADVATLTVLLGVLGGVSRFGVIGLFLGPVVLALALALIRFAITQRHSAVEP